ncbi:translesion DNA synthesis-associated protein ImuA [Halioxenophilus sp. WMMB6]|uniref:translesion DNA synthesis-associated protein ImuA n=1 Tax=Halioxenophilus sp. WMMB6 TaxID=3073815 RepID=UPI00295ECDEC|nr:translesion DNA synthesis-associated protein ImuA [Halioxenophilus sp. WMMB6]
MTYQTRTTPPQSQASLYGSGPGLAGRATGNSVLEQLLARKDVWRGTVTAGQNEVLDSGYGSLNSCLQGGGWPLGSLIDLSQANNGHGEWQLFGPTLARLSHQAGLIVLVNPPAQPYGPGLAQLGINYQAIKVVRTRQRQALLSALVDTLQAQCCLAVLAWEGRFNWRYAELRKLQLAASQSQCLSVCLRQDRSGRVQSPAPLRLRSQLSGQGLQVQLLKQRGQFRPQVCTLPLPSLWAPEHAELLHTEANAASAQQGAGEQALAKVLAFNTGPKASQPRQGRPGGE